MSICSAKEQYGSYREGVYAIIFNCLSISLKRIIKATSAVCSIDYIHTTFGNKLANVYAIDIKQYCFKSYFTQTLTINILVFKYILVLKSKYDNI